MPILELQQRLAQVGRIRLGIKVKGANGRERPEKLDRLRFTSPRRELIETIASLYGGEVRLWEPPRGNAQWEVITEVTEVPVLVPPQDVGGAQWLELWTKGGCKRRCDGHTERLSGAPCLCGPDPLRRECKMHTRITVMLSQVKSAGVWLIDTSSFYAGTELPGITKVLAESQGIIPGRLILDQRSVVRDGKTFNFAVPVIDSDGFTAAELVSGRAPELARQRIAAELEANAAAASIAAAASPISQVLACKTRPELQALWERFGADPAIVLDDELRAAFKDAGAAVDAAAEMEAEEIVDAEIVDEENEEPGW